MAIKVSIVVRCYNEEQHIGKLLSGITQQTRQDFEIILVDSGSTDATLSIASLYPVQILSIKPEEFSFGRSLNLGCAAAKGEFIVIVSAHVYPVYQDWIEQLLKPFSDPQIALVYGKQRGNETTKYSEHQIFAKWFPEESDLNQTHPFCNNANAAIRRSLWNQISYDESLTGLEDIAWAKQLIQQGHRIAYAAEAEIIHVHDETPQRIYNRYRREAIAFARVFSQESFSFWNFVRLLFTNIFSDYYHAGQEGVLHWNLISIPIFRLMQFWGTYQGFRQQGLIPRQLRQKFYYPRQITRRRVIADDKSKQAIDYNQPKPKLVRGKVH